MLTMKWTGAAALAATLLLTSCGMGGNDSTGKDSDSTSVPERKVPDREKVTYTFVSGKDSSLKGYAGAQIEALQFVNRCDEAALRKKDTVLVPSVFTEVMQYSPFPFRVSGLNEVKKIVFFSYPAQVFAAYENGYLVHTGPTNMGRKADPTPTGLYFCNWKAEETTSTFNDEWELKWNFNIENKLGVGWHQYAMPGYPASHSCLRMLEADARKMYAWADEWVLEGTDNVKANGTPVIVFGNYPFDGEKPWMALVADPKALDISEEALMQQVQPHLQKIRDEQAKLGQYK
ncbi:MAG: L,D-transpeptidase [Flavipsychrobacter sp.]|nr:L,D-transpeptidase [Flavipsychrobacter sp.]